MIARRCLFVALLGTTLLACAPTTTPIDSSRIERGTALPPPGLTPAGLAAPAR